MSFSITLSGSAHSAPSGFAGGFESGLVSSGTPITNASIVPAGDHASERGPCWRRVTWAVAPESIQRTKIWAPPASLATYAMRPPSGDQRGDEAFFTSGLWLRP